MAGQHHHGHRHLHLRRGGLQHAAVEPATEAVARNELPVSGRADSSHMRSLLASREAEMPVGPNTTNIAIACGIAIPLVAAIVVLLYLHRRGVLKQKKEDAEDKYKSMDFGLGENIGSKPGKRRSNFFGREKEPTHKTQLSMDMNLSSPYLLPPTLQQSRESLARSLKKEEDPYQIVTDYSMSDVGSLRSFRKGAASRGSSIYSGKTGTTRPSMDPPNGKNFPPRQKSLPPTSPLPQIPQAAQRAEVVDDIPPPELPMKNEFRFAENEPSRPQLAVSTIPEDQVVNIQEPPQAASRVTSQGVPATTRSTRTLSDQSAAGGYGRDIRGMHDRDSGTLPARDSQQSAGLGIMGSAPYPNGNDAMPVVVTDHHSDTNGFDFNLPNQQQEDDYGLKAYDAHAPNEHEYPQSAGLGVPAQDSRRLSVGFRPLPPDDYLESEDPEFRANRIRSFYKEYFDDSVKQDSGRPPAIPQQDAGYYEGYDANYLGEAAFFDPETNAFVMPYAQPVTRRAMTPPPSSRRPMPAPRQRAASRGPPMPGAPFGRPRAGSTMSGGRFGPGTMSPRPGSSASNQRFSNKPRKPMPPPAALSTLPTPSKLKDDSFAIFNATDFAPPPNFKDQAAGRSQSPVGERRPYHSPSVPVHSPLVSAYDETLALPSPHLLRKSGTFTALDLAPPRRFKDSDTMSDAGSIRSNNSGLSSKNAIALRNGAGRVSRLPGDTVFTQVDLQNTLKPQWSMGR